MAAVGSFDDETIGRLVSKIVDEVQDSMLNFELQKAAQVNYVFIYFMLIYHHAVVDDFTDF